MNPTTKIALYVAGGLAAAGVLYYVTRPTALLMPAKAPPTAATLTPVALPLPTVPLIRGRHYYAIANVGWAAHAVASLAQVVAYAQKQGFTNVQAYASSNNLPVWWPAAARTGASGSFWVEGDYNQASKQFNLPSQIVAAWILGPENVA